MTHVDCASLPHQLTLFEQISDETTHDTVVCLLLIIHVLLRDGGKARGGECCKQIIIPLIFSDNFLLIGVL